MHVFVWENSENCIGLDFDYARHLKSPRKWGTILFGGLERGDIKCSQILFLTCH